MKRTKDADRSPYPEMYQPWGGHIPFPPRDCPCRERSFVDKSSGMRWIHNYFCRSNKCKRSPCPRYKQYKAGGNAEWRNESQRLTEVARRLRGEDDGADI